MNRTTIRPVDLTDGGEMLALLSLQMAAYVKEAEMIGLPDIPPLFESPDSIRESGEVFYGCYQGDDLALAGAVSVKRNRKNWVLCRLMVRPDRLRRGIASRLLRYLLGLASKEQTPRVIVRTVSTHTAAMALYQSMGFRPVREMTLENGIPMTELAAEPSDSPGHTQTETE